MNLTPFNEPHFGNFQVPHPSRQVLLRVQTLALHFCVSHSSTVNELVYLMGWLVSAILRSEAITS